MAHPESLMRRALVQAMRKAGLDPVPVENAISSGTPDVNYVGGWLELKVLQVPKIPETPVKAPHFTADQKNFIIRRTNAGGRCHVVLRCRKKWLVLDGLTAVSILGSSPISVLVTSRRNPLTTLSGAVSYLRYPFSAR